MKKVVLDNGVEIVANTREELEEKIWEEISNQITVVGGGPNMNPEHYKLVEEEFDEVMSQI